MMSLCHENHSEHDLWVPDYDGTSKFSTSHMWCNKFKKRAVHKNIIGEAMSANEDAAKVFQKLL